MVRRQLDTGGVARGLGSSVEGEQGADSCQVARVYPAPGTQERFVAAEERAA